jgi:hypothetical protein
LSYAVAFGNTRERILEEAELQEADMLVVGLHRSIRLASHLPERLSYRIFCEAPCPVLTVPPSSRDLKPAEMPVVFRSMPVTVN